MGFRVGIKGDLRDFGLSLWALVGLGACGISDFRLGLAPGFGLGACGISGFRFRVGTKGELWDFRAFDDLWDSGLSVSTCLIRKGTWLTTCMVLLPPLGADAYRRCGFEV